MKFFVCNSGKNTKKTYYIHGVFKRFIPSPRVYLAMSSNNKSYANIAHV